MNNLANRQIVESSNCLTLKYIVDSLNLGSSKVHLTEEEFTRIIHMYYPGRHKKDFYAEMSLYKNIIRIYPTLEQWGNAPLEKKLIDGRGSKALYYYILVLCGRMQVDWNIMNSNCRFPTILSISEERKIVSTGIQLKYSEEVCKRVVIFIEKIIVCTRKSLNEINEDDIYKYRNFHVKREVGKSTFLILKSLGNIDEFAQYQINGRENIKNVNTIEFKNQHPDILRIYEEFRQSIRNTCTKSSSEKALLITKYFLNWLWQERKDYINLKTITMEDIRDFSRILKTTKSLQTGKPLSKKSVNSMLSSLKEFIGFIVNKSYVSSKSIIDFSDYNEIYYQNANAEIMPDIVPIKDRIKIEEAIYSLNYPKYPLVEKMFKILYLLGLRPSELLALKVDCIRGTKEAPLLYIHKCKREMERYIPLPSEEYEIINELARENKDSHPIYFDYDGLTCKRLFNFRGGLIIRSSLNFIFKNMLVSNGIVDSNKKAKYSLYILRKIRITTWLEMGLSEYEVSYLVGHRDVNSHNHYIVSKEARIENARKVYETFYKDFFEQIKANGYYEEKANEKKEEDDEEYLKKLQDTLLQIESKTVNKELMEQVSRNFPELVFPVPCGNCFAMAVLNSDFECERMTFPCLECDELLDAENYIGEFDKYVKRIYESYVIHKKRNLEGMIARDMAIVGRLKNFYSLKFNMDVDAVNSRFERMENEVTPVRGRPKKK